VHIANPDGFRAIVEEAMKATPPFTMPTRSATAAFSP
jgi:hypothetical protein